MHTEQIKTILEKIKTVKIAVLGDFCLDAYWILNPKGGEISVETGLHAQAVAKHYYSLGGASNVVANIAALKPAYIQAIGVIGDDIFGRELNGQLRGLGVDTSSIIIQKEQFDTVTFAKRYIGDTEEPRIDFGFFNKRSSATDAEIIKHVRNALEKMDVVIFNQQVPGSLTEEFVQNLNSLLAEYQNKIVILDSRHYGGRFKNIYRKTNEVEAAMLNGLELETTDVLSLSDVKKHALNLYKESSKPVFITRGSRGLLVVDSTRTNIVPGIQLFKKIDTVGAGDTTLTALALCLGAGIGAYEAAEFANFSAVVTVQKLFMTGTASPEEVLEVAKDPDYIYEPELAKDIRQALYFNGSEIEICTNPMPNFANIRHAVFDHDGTISTLRQGWEQIMEPVMVKAILGSQYKTADETLYYRVINRVREYIDKSTGIETLIQMAGLVEMVKEFGIVGPDQILTKFEYKKIYNAALMEVVNQRTAKLKKGELNLEDFTIKGAVAFLKTLRSKGIKLYLASGTDNADVSNEANVLGYADLFDGGIYGALDDSDKYSKKMVIQRIIRENNLQGSQLVAFGDGPVELRESRKNAGLAIGIASNEVQRYGLNLEKRARLIKAGANLVIPDFSQADKLMSLLFKE